MPSVYTVEFTMIRLFLRSANCKYFHQIDRLIFARVYYQNRNHHIRRPFSCKHVITTCLIFIRHKALLT